jgi:hypothetical protein
MRGKRRPLGRGRIARMPKAFIVRLARRLLLLDVASKKIGEHFVAIMIAYIGKTQRLRRQMSLLWCMHRSKIGTMQRLQAFKYELRPNGEQKRNMGRFAGSRRFVYNTGLALQRAHYEAGGTFISRSDYG